MGRKSKLDMHDGLIEDIAELVMDGLNNREIAETLGMGTHPDTVKGWKKDPRVQAAMSRIRQEHINRIDSKIVNRLKGMIETPDILAKLDVDTLLKIRKELLPPAAQRHVVSRGQDETMAMEELYTMLANKPDMAEALGLAGAPPDEDVRELEAGDVVDGEAELDES